MLLDITFRTYLRRSLLLIAFGFRALGALFNLIAAGLSGGAEFILHERVAQGNSAMISRGQDKHARQMWSQIRRDARGTHNRISGVSVVHPARRPMPSLAAVQGEEFDLSEIPF